jgi:hypothetical protein
LLIVELGRSLSKQKLLSITDSVEGDFGENEPPLNHSMTQEANLPNVWFDMLASCNSSMVWTISRGRMQPGALFTRLRSILSQY